MSMNTPLSDNDPRLVAWNNYKRTDEYANTQHLQSSLWAVFLAGWEASAKHASLNAAAPAQDIDKKINDKPIERKPVTSSNIVSVGFCPDRKCIDVEFKNGGIYRYHDCDQALFDNLMKAESVGKFVNKHLKLKRFTKQ